MVVKSTLVAIGEQFENGSIGTIISSLNYLIDISPNCHLCPIIDRTVVRFLNPALTENVEFTLQWNIFPRAMYIKLGLYFMRSLADADIHAECRCCTAAARVFQRKLRRAKKASVYVRASPLVYAGLESSISLNSAEVCARLRPHTLACVGPCLRQKYKQLRWLTLNATNCVR